MTYTSESIKWYFKHNQIGTNTVLHIKNVSSKDSGFYYCIGYMSGLEIFNARAILQVRSKFFLLYHIQLTLPFHILKDDENDI